MKKIVVALALVSVAALLLWSAPAFAGEAITITRLTNNSVDEDWPRVSGDRVTWQTNDGNDYEIVTWTPSGGAVQLTSNSYDDGGAQVSGDRVVWAAYDGADYEIYTWTPTGGTVKLTNNTVRDEAPYVSEDRIVWQRGDYPNAQIMTWTPAGGAVQLTSGSGDHGAPRVSGDRVIWGASEEDGDTQIYTWTPAGGTVQVSSGVGVKTDQDVSGDRIVWSTSVSGIGSDVFTWTPSEGMVQLTFDAASEYHTRVSGDRVVWEGDDGTAQQIFTWTPGGGEVRLTSGPGGRSNPTVSGDRVVWWGRGISTNSEITMWTPAGGSQQLSTNGKASYPIISGDRMVWLSIPATTYEIYTAVADDKPAISGLSPASGPAGGGNTVIISGYNLLKVAGASGVTFGGVNAPYTVDSDSQITAIAPAHVAGPITVGVWAGTGPVGYGADPYVYAGVPTITNLSRHTGSTDGGTVVIISGTEFYGLSGAAAVTFGGVNAASYTVDSSTQITAVSPAHAAGIGNVVVAAVGGTSVDAGVADDFTYGVVSATISRVSVSAAGVQATKASRSPAISADGRYVAFASTASNLVPGGVNGNLLVRDLQTGNVEMVSVDSSGNPANSMSNFEESLSADGRYVVFVSDATNLVEGDTSASMEVFVHDRGTGTTTRASVSTAGVEANDYSHMPSISADGRYVVFYSAATNLVSGDTNGGADVFLHDMQTGTTSRISVSSSGTAGNGDSFFASISANGRYVVFTSAATNLVSGDTNGTEDVFVRDLQAGTTTRVSVSSSGGQCSGASSEDVMASISADGRYVAFEMAATGLVSGDTNGTNDVFLRDRTAGTTVRVSVASDGSQGNGMSRCPNVSSDGRYVAFDSAATNLVAGDTNAVSDVFVHDCLTGTTIRVSEQEGGAQGNGRSSMSTFSMSSDGRKVAFYSLASNLVAGDTNAVQDVFLGLCPSATRFEETDPGLLWAGTWTSFPTASASGGVYKRANTGGSSVTIYFHGTRLDWLAMKGTTTGKAEVTLDDGPATAVDLNATSATYKVKLWSTGTILSGIHKVVISWKADVVAGRYVTLDAVDVVGDLVGAPPTITGISPHTGSTAGGDHVVITGTDFVGLSGPSAVTFDGVDATSYTVGSATQITAVTPAHAAGTVRVQITTPGGFTLDSASDDFTYAVPGPPTITSISPNTGSIDGGTTVTITGTDFAGLSGPSAVTFGGVNAATYTRMSATTITAVAPPHAAGAVQVQVTAFGGTTADLSTDDFTYTVAPPVIRYDQTNGNIVKTGTWTNYGSTPSCGASYGRASTAGASATIWFTGTQLDYIAFKGTTTGKADIYVDGVKVTGTTPINLYSSPVAYQQNVWSTGPLTNGLHSVKIVRSASSATGKYVTLDAVDIYGTISAPPTRYEQANAYIHKVGSWADLSKAAASGTSYGRSLASTTSATVHFTGTRIDYIGMKGTTTGIAEVWLDGELKATIDLAATVATYNVLIWSSGTIGGGAHTLSIVRNVGSVATEYLTLDAVDIWGTITP